MHVVALRAALTGIQQCPSNWPQRRRTRGQEICPQFDMYTRTRSFLRVPCGINDLEFIHTTSWPRYLSSCLQSHPSIAGLDHCAVVTLAGDPPLDPPPFIRSGSALPVLLPISQGLPIAVQLRLHSANPLPLCHLPTRYGAVQATD